MARVNTRVHWQETSTVMERHLAPQLRPNHDPEFQALMDRTTAFAAREFGTRMAMVSLMESDRLRAHSWFGLEASRFPHGLSFCEHVVIAAATLAVPDARDDARFGEEPMVIGEPHIGFYAGAPLRLADAQVVGTLCVMDQMPRRFDRLDLAILEGMTDFLMMELQRTYGQDLIK